MSWPNSITIHPINYFFECSLLMLKSQCSGWIATITYIICLFTLSILYVYKIPNLSVVCFFICLSYFIFYCALLLFCAQAWHGKTLSSRNDPIFFCSLHWRNLSLYNKITTTHFKQIRFWWKNVITFRGKVYSNFFKLVQQLFFWSAVGVSIRLGLWVISKECPVPAVWAQTGSQKYLCVLIKPARS